MHGFIWRFEVFISDFDSSLCRSIALRRQPARHHKLDDNFIFTTVSTSYLVNIKIIFSCLYGYNMHYLTLGKQQVLEIGPEQNTVN